GVGTNQKRPSIGRPFSIVSALIRSGEALVSIPAEVIRIEIHVVMIIVVRCGIKQSGARTIVGAIAGRADVVDPGVARETAAGLIRPRTFSRGPLAHRIGIAEALMASPHHRADTAEQQRSAAHPGGGRRRGSQKRAAAAHRAAHWSLGCAIWLPVGTL